jgi:hypothetical protein
LKQYSKNHEDVKKALNWHRDTADDKVQDYGDTSIELSEERITMKYEGSCHKIMENVYSSESITVKEHVTNLVQQLQVHGIDQRQEDMCGWLYMEATYEFDEIGKLANWKGKYCALQICDGWYGKRVFIIFPHQDFAGMMTAMQRQRCVLTRKEYPQGYDKAEIRNYEYDEEMAQTIQVPYARIKQDMSTRDVYQQRT